MMQIGRSAASGKNNLCQVVAAALRTFRVSMGGKVVSAMFFA